METSGSVRYSPGCPEVAKLFQKVFEFRATSGNSALNFGECFNRGFIATKSHFSISMIPQDTLRFPSHSGEQEIPRFFDKYEVLRFLGFGGSSITVLVRDQVRKTEFACKVVSRKFLCETGTFPRFEQEVRLMEQLHHANIVRLIEVVFDPIYIYVIMEHCRHGDLCQLIEETGALHGPLLRMMFGRIVAGVTYLHEKGIAHRDLKPDNILLDEDRTPKISDFGLCHIIPETGLLSTQCGTPYYAAPEILLHQNYDGQAVDVWSLGVVLCTMVAGALPWPTLEMPAVFQCIIEGKYELPMPCSTLLAGLVRGMLQVDPSQRMTLKQVADHPWLKAFVPKAIRPILPTRAPLANSRWSPANWSHRPVTSTASPSVGAADSGERLKRLLMRQRPGKTRVVRRLLKNAFRFATSAVGLD
jgi:serine/threonine protein kinase